MAAVSGRADIGAILLHGGADYTTYDAHGWDARQIALFHRHSDFLSLLTEAEEGEGERQEELRIRGQANNIQHNTTSYSGDFQAYLLYYTTLYTIL